MALSQGLTIIDIKKILDDAEADPKLLEAVLAQATPAQRQQIARLGGSPQEEDLFATGQGFANQLSAGRQDALNAALAAQGRAASDRTLEQMNARGQAPRSGIFQRGLSDVLSGLSTDTELSDQRRRSGDTASFFGAGRAGAASENRGQFEGNLATSLANAGAANRAGISNAQSIRDANEARFVNQGTKRRRMMGLMTGAATTGGGIAETMSSRGRSR